jgi:rare lipoprotein A
MRVFETMSSMLVARSGRRLWRPNRTFFALALLSLPTLSSALSGCGGGAYDSDLGVTSSPRVSSGDRVPKGGGVYKVGSPYRVAGRWYHPQENPNYDRVGTASWYGTAFHGRKTANGEVYDMYALSAGHPTLPLPSYAYVTNLGNGRTVLVRINDRGPYARDRLIDLSYQTARTLGFHEHGLARVRVRYAGRAPLDGDDSAERRFVAAQSWSGSRFASAAAQAPISTGSLNTTRADRNYGSQQAPAAPSWSVAQYRRGGLTPRPGESPASALGANVAETYLRVGPFSSEAEAERLRFMLAGPDPSAIEPAGAPGDIAFGVRLGPYDDAGAAAAMARIAAAGYDPDASTQMTRDRSSNR